MVTLTFTNQYLLIEGADRQTIRRLTAATSYKIAGAEWAPAFKERRWDGREDLLRFSKTLGYHVPSGLAQDVIDVLREHGVPYTVKHETILRHPRRVLPWNPAIQMRGYQKEAITAILKGRHPRGMGVISMPIRSGKTKTAARLIWKIGRPAIFLVPAKHLLHQTAKSFEECFPGEPIGMIGDGVFDLRSITVATLQTLGGWRGRRANSKKGTQGSKKDPRYDLILNSFDVVIQDEVHHIRGQGEWHQVLADFPARFKIGLSATVFPDLKEEIERGILWVRATCGPVKIHIPISRLVEEGYLLPQHVEMYKVQSPKGFEQRGWSARTRQRCQTLNPALNRHAARKADELSASGFKVLIIARLHEQIGAVCEALDDLGVTHLAVTGRDSKFARDEAVNSLLDGSVRVLVGNVLGEGVDIPALDVVINVEGGKDVKQTIQRQRNLTISKGKKKALLIDYYNETNRYLEGHSSQRLEAYKSEPAFRVEVLKM